MRPFSELFEVMESQSGEHAGAEEPLEGMDKCAHSTLPRSRDCPSDEELGGFVDGQLRKRSLRRWLHVWGHVWVRRCQACQAARTNLVAACRLIEEMDPCLQPRVKFLPQCWARVPVPAFGCLAMVVLLVLLWAQHGAPVYEASEKERQQLASTAGLASQEGKDAVKLDAARRSESLQAWAKSPALREQTSQQHLSTLGEHIDPVAMLAAVTDQANLVRDSPDSNITMTRKAVARDSLSRMTWVFDADPPEEFFSEFSEDSQHQTQMRQENARDLAIDYSAKFFSASPVMELNDVVSNTSVQFLLTAADNQADLNLLYAAYRATRATGATVVKNISFSGLNAYQVLTQVITPVTLANKQYQEPLGRILDRIDQELVRADRTMLNVAEWHALGATVEYLAGVGLQVTDASEEFLAMRNSVERMAAKLKQVKPWMQTVAALQSERAQLQQELAVVRAREASLQARLNDAQAQQHSWQLRQGRSLQQRVSDAPCDCGEKPGQRWTRFLEGKADAKVQ